MSEQFIEWEIDWIYLVFEIPRDYDERSSIYWVGLEIPHTEGLQKLYVEVISCKTT